MILTIRKFLNLVLSVVIFQNPFTLLQTVATVLVFLGTFAFYDVPQQIIARCRSRRKEKAL